MKTTLSHLPQSKQDQLGAVVAITLEKVPRELNPAQRVEKSTEEFEHWFESANLFLVTFEFLCQEASGRPVYYNNAAFELHQAPERYYAAILLVFTDYKPRIHDIEILGNQVIKQTLNKKG